MKFYIKKNIIKKDFEEILILPISKIIVKLKK